MKLNYKRTFIVGLAFMSICAFWQLYDNIIPLILKNTFHVPDSIAGVIMAMDNVIALFLLPILGAFSDKCNTKIGRRMPFILTGTGIAILLMTFIPLLDNAYYHNSSSILLVGFIICLGLLLIAMASYRSPAVALMPDLTPKPLRSKANAIINLMGAVGGIFYLILTTFLFSEKRTMGIDHINYQLIFAIIAVVMLLSIIILFFSINEPKCSKEMYKYEEFHNEEDPDITDKATGKEALPREVRKSMGFLLASIALWFTGYNAVTTSFSKYATIEWGMSLGSANLCLTVATAVAIISYIPIGELAVKIGRKKSIIIGILLLAFCFAFGSFMTFVLKGYSPILLIIFGIIGIAWAMISVNSLPMVVEMCSESDIGKFTGYYYTFSMAAQIITPIISGILLQFIGYWTLFPYGALFVGFSLFTMLKVHHGDNKPKKKESRLEMLDIDN